MRKTKKEIKAVIFDLDGTLAYTMKDLQTGMNLMLEEFGYPTHTERELLLLINKGARAFVTGALPKEVQDNESMVDRALERYQYHYSRHYMEDTHLYEGIAQTVAELRRMGIELAVFSNKDENHVRAIVEKLLPDTFSYVTGFSGKFPHKPAPDTVRYILEGWKVDPEEALYIGDSVVDVQTAKNAGVFCIGVAWGFGGRASFDTGRPDLIIERPSEILAYIREERI